MVTIDIPNFGRLELAHAVLDFNGTLACDGTLLPGVDNRLRRLADRLEIHVLTADTFGTCRTVLQGLPVGVSVLGTGREDAAKQAFVRGLGARQCAAVGNGRNDALMLRECALGIAVMGTEGTFPGALTAADVVTPDIAAALDLLCNPMRLRATLRI